MDGSGTTPMSTAGPQSGSSQPNDDSREDPNQRKANVRKRTKTGCLTCRKRRIKCDEAKPTCKNCIKSRRHCDGYNQRVIFKEPIGSLSASFGPNAFSIGSSHLTDDSLSNQQAGQPSRVPLQVIAPRPPSFDFNQSLHIPINQENVPFQLPFHETQLVDMPLFHKLSSGAFLPPTYPQIQNPLLASDIQPLLPCQPSRPKPTPGFSVLPPDDDIASEEPSAMAILDNAMVLYRQPSSVPLINEGHLQNELASRHFMADSLDTGQRPSSGIMARDFLPITLNSTSHSHPLAHVIVPDETDEDRSMPDSDDDYQDAQEIVAPAMTASADHRSATEMRTFGAYAGTWAVSAYLDHPNIPEFWHSGLRDIFTHFINVTGPAIMLYEPLAFDQHPRHAELVAGHGLWRSTFPQMALRHPALLQAMLALGSLQLAKLQNYTLAAALKHYHLALRRIGKIMQSDLRRRHPATLAATLMLGYFEVWAADHSKWSQHLWGARVLLQEIPLKEMTRKCLPTKRWRQLSQQRRQMNPYFPGLMSGPQPSSTILDYGLLSILTGTTVTSEDYGDVTPSQWDPSCFAASDKDVDNFEIYSDLFWWYCKMDVYQSFLAGTKLFMEFEHWTQCPPRAAFSNAGTPFGTYDHLVLLLGRLANFAFKDRSRKRKLARSRAGGAAGGSPPMFPGMLPLQGRIRAPIGLAVPRETSPQSDSNEEFDAQGSMQNALQEWESIRQAFQVFREHLGLEFGKLESEYGDLPDTPFGSAVQYRSYTIAGIWMNYYMGMIFLFRSHPEMPQASLQAAGLQAAKTRDYALEIGRIAAGTVLNLSGVTEINTFLAAVLIESCFCLFVAGVQFRDSAQRQWTIQRMYDISRLTGWQSAGQVAAGCESAWIKAYELSVGPPYARTSLFSFKSIWDNPRRIDSKIRELVPGEDEPIVLANSDRANYALGLLSVEEDLKVLELED